MEAFAERFGSKPEDLRAAIGPSICPEEYEIGAEVYEQFVRAYPEAEDWFVPLEERGKYLFDLWEANRRQLAASGIADHHLELAGMCTYRDTDRFFSALRESPTGRMAAGIMLKE